jgi:hypothetical protein
MLQAFVDESVSDRAFVLAGLIATEETWLGFSDAWGSALKAGRPIEYFKMKDYLQGSGQFSGFSKEERDAKFNVLKGLIPNGAEGIVCITDIAAYHGVINGRISKTMDYPLYFTAFELMGNTLRNMYKHGVTQPIDFIFDAGNAGYFREIQNCWKRWKQFCPPPIRRRMGNAPIERDDKTTMPLQAADLLAGHARKYLADTRLDAKSSQGLGLPGVQFPLQIFTFREDTIASRFADFLRVAPEQFDYEEGKDRSRRHRAASKP